MPEKLSEAWQKKGLLEEGDRLVVGISGGADSVFLLHVLEKIRKRFNLTLRAAHFNHSLRGEDSDQDEAFTASFCEKRGLPFRRARWERKGGNGSVSEERAREVRYQFFERICREEGADKIALAHTRDDDVETILFRFLRGSGLAGLRGIPDERPLGPYRIIRPLKELSREVIRAYLRREGIPWREDHSNTDLRYTRNRIRHNLLPLLEKEFNPNIRQILVHLANNVAEDYAFLQKEGELAFEKALLKQGRRKIIFRRKTFQSYPMAIQKQLFRQAVRNLGTDMDEIGYADWKSVSECLRHKTFRYTLPGPLSVQGTPTKMVFASPRERGTS